ncbi:calcium-binding protein [Comamonas serinivorans]|uniref:Calcium-binding protein n=1 Tax=Comamonas serinivorans TaxID=1082851 RepID=A0A1Y0ENX5_9BURK|nr:DUF937 domain-containing protein [Comamonas serinivorans]ARU05002.1 calcium-binding protein [Comamonas serinivorans]
MSNNSLVSELLAQLDGAPTQQIAQQLGVGGQDANTAISAAVPMLLGALGNNASQAGGADALFNALTRDHAPAVNPALGGVDLGGLLGSVLGGLGGGAPASAQLDGGSILGHVFGNAQDRAQDGLGQATGLNNGQAGQLLKILAPIVMAFLAKRVMAGGLNSGGLGSMLGQETNEIRQGGSAGGSLGGGLLGAVLDQNGDGKLDVGDLLKIGGSLLGGRR